MPVRRVKALITALAPGLNPGPPPGSPSPSPAPQRSQPRALTPPSRTTPAPQRPAGPELPSRSRQPPTASQQHSEGWHSMAWHSMTAQHGTGHKLASKYVTQDSRCNWIAATAPMPSRQLQGPPNKAQTSSMKCEVLQGLNSCRHGQAAHLGGDTRVVCSWQPQCLLASHPGIARHHIL